MINRWPEDYHSAVRRYSSPKHQVAVLEQPQGAGTALYFVTLVGGGGLCLGEAQLIAFHPPAAANRLPTHSPS